ncbi:MAG: hypothetical protein RLZZ373_3219 [Pseudomonadota bacterium]|jgi:hypothetical protein
MRAVIMAVLAVGPAAAAPGFDCARWESGTQGYVTMATGLGKQSAQQHDAGNFTASRELARRQGLSLQLVRQRDAIAQRQCVWP